MRFGFGFTTCYCWVRIRVLGKVRFWVRVRGIVNVRFRVSVRVWVWVTVMIRFQLRNRVP